MRHFSSYGPIDKDLHYFATRKELIHKAYTQLLGENPKKGGHYITVWAPRQTGKSWLMGQILNLLQENNHFDAIKINLEHLKDQTSIPKIIEAISEEIGEELNKNFKNIDTLTKFQKIFKQGVLERPLILILDEFDALPQEGISELVSVFRNIYIKRMDETSKSAGEKTYLLHSVALIGVRSVLGIGNIKGSPFNVQRSLHIPNLTHEEVKEMFKWFQKESGQEMMPEVIDKLYNETKGQPGLACWLGELLTETYNEKSDQPITLDNLERTMEAAVNLLPNSNILNIINKANQDPHKTLVLEMFRTDELFHFKFDDKSTNFLYMNGVIEPVEIGKKNFIKFSNPFIQKRLFNYFSNELFHDMGRLKEPLDTLEDSITEHNLNIRNIISLYQSHLDKNKYWLFKDVPRRRDLRIFEAVFHFNIYMFLFKLLESRGGSVYPEFPTGNGQIDIVISYHQQLYGIELKTFSDVNQHKKALTRAAQYGSQLHLKEIFLVFFIDSIDSENRKKYETQFTDESTQVKVIPIFVETGN
jgi:hypothetical protein